ncbi:MAG TPA: HAD hydrolase family protein [Candidatus Saccharimonadales bacterium]|nr:HAD hydrolase family protein [Candidatus Saccharimonadales bacterium]
MRETKLVFADVDGTMLPRYTDEPTPRVVQAVADFFDEGGLLVPTTTRSADLMRTPAAMLGLRHLGVLDGGATIFDFQTGQRDAEHTRWLSPKHIQEIVSAIGEFCTEISYEEAYCSHTPAEVAMDAITESAPSVFAIFESEREAFIAGTLENLGVDGYPNAYEDSETLRCMQIVRVGVNKQTGVQALLEGPYADVRANNIMVISDNQTDDKLLASMPDGAHKLAMGNAPMSLQECADRVVPHVDSDGFAIALEDFMWGRYDV